MYLKNTASYRVKVLDTVFNTHKFTKSVSLSLFAKDLTKLKKKKKHELCQLNYLVHSYLNVYKHLMKNLHLQGLLYCLFLSAALSQTVFFQLSFCCHVL